MVEVGATSVINQQIYYSLKGYTAQTVLVRINEHNDLVRSDDQNNRDELVTAFNPLVSGWWDSPARGCGLQGRTSARRVQYDGPIGTLRDVLELGYRTFVCADTGTQSEQYADHIGMLRRVDNSFIGPRQFDLIYARVGTIEIDASGRGSFTLSIPSIDSKNINATLRLHTEEPVQIHFPAGQEFEAVLIDSNGNTIWRWSDGKIFTQALHDVNSTDWSVAFTIPVPSKPGSYEIRGWLTTATPTFAASAPITIGAGSK